MIFLEGKICLGRIKTVKELWADGKRVDQFNVAYKRKTDETVIRFKTPLLNMRTLEIIYGNSA